jgi:hypothetical protein
VKPENDLTTEAMLHREAIKRIHKLQDALTKIAQMRPHKEAAKEMKETAEKAISS